MGAIKRWVYKVSDTVFDIANIVTFMVMSIILFVGWWVVFISVLMLQVGAVVIGAIWLWNTLLTFL